MLDDRIQEKYNKIYDRNTELGYILTKYLIKAEKASSVDTLDETIIDLFADVDSYYRLIICSMQDAIIKSGNKGVHFDPTLDLNPKIFHTSSPND